MKYTIRKRFNPNHDEKGLFASGAGGLAETNGTAPTVGHPFLVYRAGSAGGSSLAYKNGGDARGVAYHMVSLDSADGPKYEKQTDNASNLTIHAFKVTLTEPPSGYRMYNDGKSVAGGLGNDVTRMGYKATEHYGDVYAFAGEGLGYKSEYLGSVPAKTVLDHLLATNTGPDFKWANNFDSFGVNIVETAVREMVGKAIRAKKFNPNHDEKGLFASSEATETNGKNLPIAGKPFLVFRASSSTVKPLLNKNAGNSWAIAHHFSTDIGQHKNQTNDAKQLTIHMFQVNTNHKMEQSTYIPYNNGTPPNKYWIDKGGIGWNTFKTGGDGGTGEAHVFSFGEKQEYTYQHLGSFPASDIYKAVSPEGLRYSTPRESDLQKALLKVAQTTLKRSVKFNPHHDEKGRFASGDGSAPDSATTLSVPNNAAMMTLMRHLSNQPNEHPNIIDLSVGGNKIFHPDKSLGIPRINMPQIPSAARDAFMSTLKGVMTKALDPTKLNPIQKELDGYKVSLFATGKNTHSIMPIVSRDNYIIDGHHNWGGAVVRAQIDPHTTIRSLVVDMDHAALLDATRRYSTAHNFAAKPIYKSAKYNIRIKFNHNHAPAGGSDGGQFTAGGEGRGIFDPTYDDQVVEDFNKISSASGWTEAEVGAFDEAHGTEHREMINDLSSASRTALVGYQGSDYHSINNLLRDPSSVKHPEDWKNPADNVHKAFDYALTIPDGTQAWRAFRSADVVAQAESGTLVGKTFVDKGFLSTSVDSYTVSDFFERKHSLAGSPVIAMRITTTNGAKGIYLGGSEYELLFDKGTSMTITRAAKTPHGLWVVDAQIKGSVTHKGDRYVVNIKFNHNHHPGGDSQGGQFDSGDGGDSSVLFEVAPDPNNKALTARWNKLSDAEKLDISKSVAADILPHTLESLDTTGKVTELIGGYLGDTNPSLAVEIADSAKSIPAAALLGYALRQDSMIVVSPNPAKGLDEVGVIAVHLPTGERDIGSLTKMYDNLYKIKASDGQPAVSGFNALHGRMEILNFPDFETGKLRIGHAELAAAVDKQLSGGYEVQHGKAYSTFLGKKEYTSASNRVEGSATVWRQNANNLRVEAGKAIETELGKRNKADGRPRYKIKRVHPGS